MSARLTSSRAFRAGLAALLAAACCLLNYFYSYAPASAAADLSRFPSGSFLLAGLPGGAVTWNMPLYPAVLAAAHFDPAVFFAFCHLALYALVFCAGSLLRGYWAGLLSLAGAGLAEAASGPAYDAEQAFYSVLLLLALALLLMKRREDNYRNNALAGLAVGASLLARTPLFLFPPVLVLCDLFYGGARPGVLARRALLFAAAAYVLLLPWGRLNRAVTGQFSLFESGRAAANVITSAKGAVFTMEGDSARLAGLAGAGGALPYYFRELARAPGAFLLTALKRLFQIFLFSPLLFGAFLAALALSREPDRLRLFCLPAYFLLIHSVLSVEARYFYPMLFLLPPLIAGSAVPPRFKPGPGAAGAAGRLTVSILAFFLCAVLFVEFLVLAYPARAARNGAGRDAYSETLARFPGDANLHGLKCRLLWGEGDDPGFRSCLAVSAERFGDPVAGYFLAVSVSRAPSLLPLPAGYELDGLVLRMLREAELGDRAAAGVSFKRAEALYAAGYNLLRGTPYEQDRLIAAEIGRDPAGFFDRRVYRLLLFWPPERMSGILAELEKIARLPGRLKLLQGLAADVKDRSGGLRLRAWIAADTFGLPLAERGLLWKEGRRKAKALSDSAVEKMRAGRLAEAEKLLLRAEGLGPDNPEVLMNLCVLRGRQERKEAALDACRLAAEAVYFNPENRLDAYEVLAAEASMERFRLLRELGRGPEAEEALREVLRTAPAGWPGLAAAERQTAR